MSKWLEGKLKDTKKLLDGAIFIPSKPFVFTNEFDYLLDWEPIFDKLGSCTNLPVRDTDEEAQKIIEKYVKFANEAEDEQERKDDLKMLDKALVDYFLLRKHNVTAARKTKYEHFIEDEKMKHDTEQQRRAVSSAMKASTDKSLTVSAKKKELNDKIAATIKRNKERKALKKTANTYNKMLAEKEKQKEKAEKERKNLLAVAERVIAMREKAKNEKAKAKTAEQVKKFIDEIKIYNKDIPPHRCKVNNLDDVTNKVVFDLLSSQVGVRKVEALIKEVLSKTITHIPESYNGNVSLYQNHAAARAINKYADSLQSLHWQSRWNREKAKK